MLEEIRKKYPYFFLIIITLIIFFIYFCVVKLLLLNIHPWTDAGTTIFLIIYHFIFLLLVWSIVQTIRTDPGRVPFQWGFAQEQKTRKYCLICHIYKPERTHHCSSCSRCVLTMDHHCPWINACIGFHNRKFFLLMLFYTILMTLINTLAYIFSVSTVISEFKKADFGYVASVVVITAAIVLNIVILVTILLFFKFHMELALTNQTTLDTLDLKRQGKNPDDEVSKYDKGKYYNWVQVFGSNSWTWWLPIYLPNQGPVGDGVLWTIDQSI